MPGWGSQPNLTTMRVGKVRSSQLGCDEERKGRKEERVAPSLGRDDDISSGSLVSRTTLGSTHRLPL